MKPKEVRHIADGYVTLIFEKIMVNVPEHFLPELNRALKGDPEELKDIAQEISDTIEEGSDPELVHHLVYSFQAQKAKLFPAPEQLELFKKEDLPDNNLPEGMEDLLNDMIQHSKEAQDEILDALISAPEAYKEEKAKYLKNQETISRINPLRAFLWASGLMGCSTWILYHWGNHHWAYWAIFAFLLICYRPLILNDKPEIQE